MHFTLKPEVIQLNRWLLFIGIKREFRNSVDTVTFDINRPILMQTNENKE